MTVVDFKKLVFWDVQNCFVEVIGFWPAVVFHFCEFVKNRDGLMVRPPSPARPIKKVCCKKSYRVSLASDCDTRKSFSWRLFIDDLFLIELSDIDVPLCRVTTRLSFAILKRECFTFTRFLQGNGCLWFLYVVYKELYSTILLWEYRVLKCIYYIGRLNI